MDTEKTCYVGSFSDEVTEDLLEELFTQVGPVTKVMMKTLKDTNTRFALVEFEDEESVLFAVETLDGIKLFNIPLCVKPKSGSEQHELYRRKRYEIEKRQNIMNNSYTPKQSRMDNDERYARNSSSYNRPPQQFSTPRDSWRCREHREYQQTRSSYREYSSRDRDYNSSRDRGNREREYFDRDSNYRRSDGYNSQRRSYRR